MIDEEVIFQNYIFIVQTLIQNKCGNDQHSKLLVEVTVVQKSLKPVTESRGLHTSANKDVQ